MPKILYSNASPYSAKVRMTAAHAGLAFESVVTDTNNAPDWLLEANPLAKIPVLIPDDGGAPIYDSRVITQYLNRETKGALFPRNAAKRLEAERMEALCDGICDAALAHIYERRSRPEEIVHQPWLDKQWGKVERALDYLGSQPLGLPSRIHVGHLALRATLAYLSVRFEGQWEKKRGKLTRWAKRFDEKFPDLAAYAPKP
jgi:glutathione S-transferase